MVHHAQQQNGNVPLVPQLSWLLKSIGIGICHIATFIIVNTIL